MLLQRHFLQTGFADLLLQELWRHLKREGMWDNSLIVVAADHGIAFIKGRRDRRRLDRGNYGEIAPIPLFIKAPGQKQGKVNDAYVETIDILPTIFDILNINPKVKMDGRSAYQPDVVSTAAPCGSSSATRSSRSASRRATSSARRRWSASATSGSSGRAATGPRGCSASARTRI